MNKHYAILNKITQLTNKIGSDYPELYRFLDENPMTLAVSKQPNVSQKAFEEYLQFLQKLIQHHTETHKNVR